MHPHQYMARLFLIVVAVTIAAVYGLLNPGVCGL